MLIVIDMNLSNFLHAHCFSLAQFVREATGRDRLDSHPLSRSPPGGVQLLMLSILIVITAYLILLLKSSLSPGSLATTGYKGHTFWDADLWVYCLHIQLVLAFTYFSIPGILH